jgi:hypothetical protein
MRTTRTITAALCAVLGTAALAGPAAAGQQSAQDSSKANVYVPPAGLSTATANDSAKASVYVPPAALYTATPAAKANVYVPPAALYTNPKPISRHVPATSAPSTGFDWGSAAIGAAVIFGALLVGLGGAAGVRRRRQIQRVATG